MNRILAGIIFFLFISTGYISFLVHERQQELQKLTHYTDSGLLLSWYHNITDLNRCLVFTLSMIR